MKVTLLLPVLLVAVGATWAQARELNSFCLPTCPYPFITLAAPKTAGACPLCYLPPYDCGPKYNKGYCCGGYTGMSCPSIACSNSQTIAISGTGGCALAYATASTYSLSQVSSSLKAAFKSTMDDVCNSIKSYNSTSTDKTVYTLVEYLTAYPTYIKEATQVWSTAIASVFYKYREYVCTCGSCPKGTTCAYASKASALVKGQVAAVATACASALSEAIADLTASGCVGSDPNDPTNAYAFSLATAMAQDVQTALQDFYKEITVVTGQPCKNAYNSGYDKAVAKAVACTVAKVFAYIYGKQTTTTTYDQYDLTKITSVESFADIYTVIDSCSASVSLTGKEADSSNLYYQKVCYYKICDFAPK